MLAHKKAHLAQPGKDPCVRPLPPQSAVICGADLPGLPAMAKSVVTLQMLLASNVVDLEAITQVIRADVGLTTQLLRLALCEFPHFSRRPLKLDEFIVLLGLQKLKSMAAGTTLLGLNPRDGVDLRASGAFWARARQTAHTAEQVAAELSPENQEWAYLAGLLRRLGSLPLLLNWSIPELDFASPGEIGLRLPKSWNFPQVLVDVIRGDEQACRSRKSRWLLRLINSAEPAIWCD
jgi:HD-like signal output (HDOD) protein